jgi:hypothetical protein
MEEKKGNVTGDFGMGAIVATCKRCQTCKYAHGEAPWADTPNKCNCEMYPPESGEIKPTEVLFDGGDCLYYEPK